MTKKMDKHLEEDVAEMILDESVLILEDTDGDDDSDDEDEDHADEVDSKDDDGTVDDEKKDKKRLVQSYDMRDQPKPETKDSPEKAVPGNKLAKDTKKPFINAKESVEAMFAGADSLSEDFRERAETIFEATVKAVLSEEIEKIEEEAQAAVDARVAEIESDLMEKVDSYLEYVVQEWMNENQIAIDASLNRDIAESFMADMMEVFEAHNIELPKDKIDLYEEVVSEMEKLKQEVNSLTEALLEKDSVLFEKEVKDIVSEMTSDMVATQAEKFKKLVEDIECADLESFKEKAGVIKESLFTKSDDSKAKVLKEEVISEKKTDSRVSQYIMNAKETNKRT